MASGETLAVFVAASSEAPSANYATFDVRNNHLVLDFDAATDEETYFTGILPSNYAGGGMSIDLYWMATSPSTTGDVVWTAAYEELDPNNNDLDSDNFGSASTATTTTNGTTGKIAETSLTISHANMGSPAAGDPFRLKITRDANAAGDTMATDAELLAVHCRET
jgi:hypothetical protein